MLSFGAEAECRIIFFSNYYLKCMKFRQIYGIRLFSFELQYSYDQRNAVACNSVVEESSFI